MKAGPALRAKPSQAEMIRFKEELSPIQGQADRSAWGSGKGVVSRVPHTWVSNQFHRLQALQSSLLTFSEAISSYAKRGHKYPQFV